MSTSNFANKKKKTTSYGCDNISYYVLLSLPLGLIFL